VAKLVVVAVVGGADRACTGTVAYRVRARAARFRVLHASSPNRLQKDEAVEPHRIAIIMRFFGGVIYRPMRQTCTIYIYLEA
jgi:hypothetical protein